MLVSTKGRYALRVMIELAGHDREEFVPLGMIAKKQDISVKYLESIIVVLSKAGLVDGLRGKGGGYRLNRAPGLCPREIPSGADPAADGRVAGAGGVPELHPEPL